MKLYKFRPLGDCRSLCHAKKMLRTGEFWCSRFWELNDPMEGVYSFTRDDRDLVDQVFSDKAKHVVCSFSGNNALSNPLMWGHYANGFKGMAIEIEVSPDSVENIEQMDYVEGVADWSSMGQSLAIEERVKKILTTKLDRWKHEDEFRFLNVPEKPARDGNGKLTGNYEKGIGEISGIYFGDPYGNVVNRNVIIEQSQALQIFKSHRCELVALAKERFPCHLMTMSHGELKSKAM